jgi:hypothetical protein
MYNVSLIFKNYKTLNISWIPYKIIMYLILLC